MKRMQQFFLFIIFSLIFGQFAYAQTNATIMGEQLERKLFSTVKNQDWSTLESIISPGFQSVNSDKIRERSAGIDYMKSLRFKDYTFQNFRVSQDPSGNVLVITYEVTYSETINQQPKAGKFTKNLSVWEKVNNNWMLVAHAVLDC